MDKIPATMRTTRARIAVAASIITAALPLTLAAACGTIGSSRNKEGATTDIEARTVKPDDPLARPIQVAWTSARASYCGFIFDPGQLRANYLASEARAGTPPTQMRKIEKAYDYTRQSVTDTIKDNLSYCNKERTAAIRADLTRYLAGDYAPNAKVAR